jgi:Tol biopolymer transport system component
MTENGHCSYLPGNEWVLNDTYPGGAHLEREKSQQLYLYHVASGKTLSLGRFDTAREYSGEWRCDLHPRFSPDGSRIVIDSVHAGDGRQMVLLDISDVKNQFAAGH